MPIYLMRGYERSIWMNNESEVKTNFVANLERLMKANNLSGGKIAKELAVDPSAVSSWRNGRYFPNLEKLSQLADLFGCKVTDLLEKPTDKIRVVDLTEEEYHCLMRFRKSNGTTREMIQRLMAYDALIQPDVSIYREGSGADEKP